MEVKAIIFFVVAKLKAVVRKFYTYCKSLVDILNPWFEPVRLFIVTIIYKIFVFFRTLISPLLFFIINIIFPDLNEKKIKAFSLIANKIDALAHEYEQLSDDALKAKTAFFKEALKNQQTLDDILVDAFAAVRETSRRVLGLYHFKEQLIGGIALHKGLMTEMKTGEGKTLVATLSAYLNALAGRVHIVTVNDYLAQRDAKEMGKIFKFLGLTVDFILEAMNDAERKTVYGADIVYVTGSQLCFDYLRDNMKMNAWETCLRDMNYAIVDEADSCLIDEGRTPCIISGKNVKSNVPYNWIANLVCQFKPEDYEKNEKLRQIHFTEAGQEKLENILYKEGVINDERPLYIEENLELLHGLNQSLKAQFLFKKDVDYIVKNKQIYLIDELTGRVLEGRRYSEGLHQAIEAKENVPIQMESNLSAYITYQSFFRLYKKISGMSGTCVAEAEEFSTIYNLDVVAVPTHKNMIRQDCDDEIYRTFKEKLSAIVQEVKIAHARKQPLLIITGSVEFSDVFSHAFIAHGLKHKILNARYHKEEAEIIAEAGMPGAITIATNMAGRGTDIQLGGNLSMRLQLLKAQGMSDAEVYARKNMIATEIAKAREVVLSAGGLYVIGTERNESRRVDDQARGRSGRQGDPGRSKFFLSLEDNLIRIFGESSNLDKWLLRFGMEEGEAIIHPYISRAIAKAQNSVEMHYFDVRKNIFKYDQVLDNQRKMIYEYRTQYLKSIDFKEKIVSFSTYALQECQIWVEQKNGDKVLAADTLKSLFDLDAAALQWDFALINDLITAKIEEKYSQKGQYLRSQFLQTIDLLWEKHLQQLNYLKEAVSLKGYAQKDPLTEYQKEAFVIFENLLEKFRAEILTNFFSSTVS